MAATERQNIGPMIQKLKEQGPAFSMFYAIYLAEALSSGLNRDLDKIEQTGLSFRPNERYTHHSTNLDSIDISFFYSVTDAAFSALARVLPDQVIQLLRVLKDKNPVTEKEFNLRLTELFSKKELKNYRRTVLQHCSQPYFRFVINMLGLYGVDSPLPRCYHEEVSFQQRTHGTGKVPLQNFLDIFNNRFYWLYYQAWKKYRLYLQLSNETNNRMMRRLTSFTGITFNSRAASLCSVAFVRFKILKLAGLFATRVRNKHGLLSLLHEFFGHIQFNIVEFLPVRVQLDTTSSLGGGVDSPDMVLGDRGNCILGKSILDRTSRICVEAGPLELEDYLEFLPGGSNLALFNDLMAVYLNDGVEYDLKLTLPSSEVTKILWMDDRAKLGFSVWLGRPDSDYAELYLDYKKLSDGSNHVLSHDS